MEIYTQGCRNKCFEGKTVLYTARVVSFQNTGDFFFPSSPKTSTQINLAEQYWEFNIYFQSLPSWIILLLPLEGLSDFLKEQSQSQK